MGKVSYNENGGRMKFIEIKEGSKTRYIRVPDDFKEEDYTKEERPTGDLTTGRRKPLNMGISKERFDEIFGGKDVKKDNA